MQNLHIERTLVSPQSKGLERIGVPGLSRGCPGAASCLRHGFATADVADGRRLLAAVAAAALPPPGAEDDPHEPAAVEDVVQARDVQVVERVLALLGLADRPLVDGGGHLQ